MKKLDVNTIIILAILLLTIFGKSCSNDTDLIIDHIDKENEVLRSNFDSLQITISSLELKVIQKDTVINHYRSYYYEIGNNIDTIKSIVALRDSIRSKLEQLGSPRFD